MSFNQYCVDNVLFFIYCFSQYHGYLIPCFIHTVVWWIRCIYQWMWCLHRVMMRSLSRYFGINLITQWLWYFNATFHWPRLILRIHILQPVTVFVFICCGRCLLLFGNFTNIWLQLLIFTRPIVWSIVVLDWCMAHITTCVYRFLC